MICAPSLIVRYLIQKVAFLGRVREILPKSVINISHAPPEHLEVPRPLTEIANSVIDTLPDGSQEDSYRSMMIRLKS